jgi:hypothetical protein
MIAYILLLYLYKSLECICGNIWGARYRSWLRHNAKSRKVEGSNPYEGIAFLNLPNPSNRSVALGSTQPLTEMSTRNLPGVN